MTMKKRPSRREQAGWTGARDNHTRQAQPAMVVPSRKEASRREQARRDNKEVRSRCAPRINHLPTPIKREERKEPTHATDHS